MREPHSRTYRQNKSEVLKAEARSNSALAPKPEPPKPPKPKPEPKPEIGPDGNPVNPG